MLDTGKTIIDSEHDFRLKDYDLDSGIHTVHMKKVCLLLLQSKIYYG